MISIILIENYDNDKALLEVKANYRHLNILTICNNDPKTWKRKVDQVRTPFVFLALNLQRFPENWGSFERGLHLLNS